jgi:hypothetical protein
MSGELSSERDVDPLDTYSVRVGVGVSGHVVCGNSNVMSAGHNSSINVRGDGPPTVRKRTRPVARPTPRPGRGLIGRDVELDRIDQALDFVTVRYGQSYTRHFTPHLGRCWPPEGADTAGMRIDGDGFQLHRDPALYPRPATTGQRRQLRVRYHLHATLRPNEPHRRPVPSGDRRSRQARYLPADRRRHGQFVVHDIGSGLRMDTRPDDGAGDHISVRIGGQVGGDVIAGSGNVVDSVGSSPGSELPDDDSVAKSPRVFVSYAHDSPKHKNLVLQLATFLRVQVGVDVHLDQWYDGQRRDWAAWASEHLQSADFILVIASPAYRRRADGLAAPHDGRGSQYEAAIIRNNLTRDLLAETQRVLPVVLPGGTVDDLPAFLCGYSMTHYRVDDFTLDGVADLLRAFSGQPASRLPRRGPYTPTTSDNDRHQAGHTEEDPVGAGTPVHHTIVVVDIEGFATPTRTLPHQLRSRTGLYQAVHDAFRAADLPWKRCRVEDRGDAVFVLIPPDIPKGPFVEVVPEALARAVRAHNHTSHDSQRIRLRMAVHAGEVAFDEHGATSAAVTSTFRLLDAPLFKKALADSPGVLALIVSRWVFDEVVRHSATLDPATFRPIPVAVKETRDTAWVALPDQPYPPDSSVLDQAAEVGHADKAGSTQPPTSVSYSGIAFHGQVTHYGDNVNGPKIVYGQETR